MKKYSGSIENFNYDKSMIYILTIFQKIYNIIRNFFSKEKGYMQARNTLILLEKLKNIFPAIQHQGQLLLPLLESIKSLQMEDLKQLCESYERVLKKRMEIIPDYNLKELHRNVNDKSGATQVSGNKGVKNEASLNKNQIISTIKTSKNTHYAKEKEGSFL